MAARCRNSCWDASFAPAATQRETVLDPFAGSGTTLAVAKKLDGSTWASSLSTEYAKLVQQRLDAIEPGDAWMELLSRW